MSYNPTCMAQFNQSGLDLRDVRKGQRLGLSEGDARKGRRVDTIRTEISQLQAELASLLAQ